MTGNVRRGMAKRKPMTTHRCRIQTWVAAVIAAFCVIGLMITSIGSATALELLDSKAFTEIYVARALQRHTDFEIVIKGPLTLQAKSKLNPEQDFTIALDNAYLTYRQGGEPLEVLLDRYANAVLAAPLQDSAVVRRENLLPTVRSVENVKSFQDSMNESTNEKSGPPQEVAQIPFIAGLHVILFFDAPDSIRIANWNDISSLGLKRDEAMQLAIANFNRIKVDAVVERMGAVAAVEVSNAMGSALLLRPEFWKRDDLRFNGDLVVFPVSRDFLLVTGSQETEGLAIGQKFATETAAQLPYALSAKPLVLLNEKWEILN
jgi:hypothetical protein